MQRFWQDQYPADVPADIDPDLYPNISAMADEPIRQFADSPAITSCGASVSYRDLGRHADTLAGFLVSELGLEPGARVAIMSPNFAQYPVALLGVLRAGLVVVNVNPLYTPRELLHQLNDSGAKAIVVCDSVTASLATVQGATALEHVIVAAVGDLLPDTHREAVSGAARQAASAASSRADLSGAIAFMEALERGRRHSVPHPATVGEDLAMLQYTGGTTGRSKGAMLTHRNIIANVLQALRLNEGGAKPTSHGDIAVTPLPLYHVYALGVFFSLLRNGVNNVLIANPRDLTGFIRTIAPLKISSMIGINTLFAGMLAHPEFDTIDFSALSFAIAGGASTQASVAQAWEERTGCAIQEGYGLSETSPVLSATPRTATPIYSGAAGFPVPSLDVRLLDEQGQDVGRDQTGEICVRGPNVMKGYWNQPEETARVLDADGWFRTGDIGAFDPDGRLRIIDRKKDMILVSGFNVYPNEVEEVLAAHPGVAEVAVVGRPSTTTGESVVAVVVKRTPELGEAELIAYAREHLAAYKVPKIVAFVGELPKTNVGKVLRRELRDSIAKLASTAG